MSAVDRAQPALAWSFDVIVHGQRIAVFTAIEGLQARYAVEEVREGGNNDVVHRLPGRVDYEPVRLTRSVDADSAALAAWFSKVRRTRDFTNARITAYDGNRKAVAHWDLVRVWPSGYTGPSLSADGMSHATETLELVHHGFTTVAG